MTDIPGEPQPKVTPSDGPQDEVPVVVPAQPVVVGTPPDPRQDEAPVVARAGPVVVGTPPDPRQDEAPVVARAGPVSAVARHDRPARSPGVRRHHPIVRITHWLTFPLVFAMIGSGLQIYRAYPRFGDRGGPYYPNPLDHVALPTWSRLGGWLAGGLDWHFTLMWPLIGVGLVYLAYMLLSGELKKLLFLPRDVAPAIQMAKYYLRLRRDHPPQGKHNALQKQAYTFILLLAMLSVLSGFAIWKPVQLSWLVAVMGGFQAARYWHFWAVWLFVGFTVVHVMLVFVADPASLRGMITSQYRGRYTSDEA